MEFILAILVGFIFFYSTGACEEIYNDHKTLFIKETKENKRRINNGYGTTKDCEKVEPSKEEEA